MCVKGVTGKSFTQSTAAVAEKQEQSRRNPYIRAVFMKYVLSPLLIGGWFIFFAFGKFTPPSPEMFIPAPGSVTLSWQKKMPTPSQPQGCKFCNVKLTVNPVAGAKQYEWNISGDAAAGFSKTTTTTTLTPFSAEPGTLTVRVRAKNGGQVSDWYEKTINVEVPADCCIN